MYTISTGIVDSDPKGESGRGTVFWLEVSDRNGVVERHEWGLLEELDGRFKPDEIKKPYIEKNKALEKEASAAEKQAKAAEKQARVDEVEDDPKLTALIDEVVAANPKAVAQFLEGKEKALNAVVGQVIGRMKNGWGPPNALKIAVLVKRQVANVQPASA